MKNKILFVDDEISVLEGLERNFKYMENKWDIKYVLSGEKAISIIKSEKIDVIVADLKMPEMNGLELLAKIKKDYPETVRIVLSGVSDQDMIIRAIEYTHQYLTKPCKVEMLKSNLENIFKIRNIINDKKVIRIISDITTIPSIPALYSNIINELLSFDKSLDVVCKIISEDVGMSANILKVINSDVFKINKTISNIEDAVNELGIEIIKTLVITFGILSRFDAITMIHFNMQEIINHSLICAKIAREISIIEKSDKITIYNSYMAGMLNDIGIIIIASNFEKEFKKIIDLTKEKDISIYKAEKEVLNITHNEIGAYLLNLWGMPYEIINAVLFSQSPSNSPGSEFSPLTSVYAANYLFYKYYKNDLFQTEIDTEYLKNINCLNKINIWEEKCIS